MMATDVESRMDVPRPRRPGAQAWGPISSAHTANSAAHLPSIRCLRSGARRLGGDPRLPAELIGSPDAASLGPSEARHAARRAAGLHRRGRADRLKGERAHT